MSGFISLPQLAMGVFALKTPAFISVLCSGEMG